MMNRQRGISIVEILVALVAGLLVVGSVLAFTVSAVKSNAENIRATRLAQELRTAITLVTREVRRAGYNLNSVDTVGTSDFANEFGTIVLDGDCIVVSYDDEDIDLGVPADYPDPEESKGFRRVVTGGNGVLEVNVQDDPPDCDAGAGGNWIEVTNPADVDVTAFTVAEVSETVETGTVGVDPSVTVRIFDITMSIALETDPTTIRTSRERIRVRADTVTFPVVGP